MKIRRRTLAKALVVVFVLNLIVMGAGAYFAYQQSPQRPARIVGPRGNTIVTGAQIRRGKATFQRNGLMNHGTILGNGAYFGVDYTADALARLVSNMREYVARDRFKAEYASLSEPKQASVNAIVKRQLEEGQFGETIHLTAAEAYAFRQVRASYVDRYHEGSLDHGIPPGFIETERAARRFADFALWTAWFSATDRPHSDVSYTNNWPYNEAAGNTPPVSSMTWSVVAMIILVAGGGIGIWLYQSIELPEPETEGIDVPHPDEIQLYPSQFAAARFIPIAALLFLAQ
ncbi:MAG: cytochrome B, partial [Halobacteriaceae archaeon]